LRRVGRPVWGAGLVSGALPAGEDVRWDVMLLLLDRISPILRLTRVTTAFAVVANSWFVVLWTRAHPEETAGPDLSAGPLWLQLGGATANALGLFGFGMCLND